MNFGDIVEVDFGTPIGSEAGFRRPAIILMSDAFLRYRPSTVFVVPLTSTPHQFPSHVEIQADGYNRLQSSSCALVEQLRAVSAQRVSDATGNVGSVIGHQLLEILATITGMP